MSLDNCIPDLTASGAISPERAQEIQSLYDELVAKHRRSMAPAAAKAQATADTIEALERAAKEAKRRKLLQMQSQMQVLKDVETFKAAGDEAMVDSFMALFARDSRAGYENVEGLARVIRNRAQSIIRQIIEEHSTGAVTGQVRNKAGLHDIIREVMGEDSGNASAKLMARAWLEAAEDLRRQFNLHGGHVGKIEGGWFPQRHDSLEVARVPKDEWIRFIWDRLDRTRMTDSRTGQPFEDDEMRDVLGTVYETITTEGWNSRKLGQFKGTALANRHADHRFLHFKDADSWLSYNERFGGADPFSAMMDHLNSLSRDIALMRRFGPNPEATIQWMKDVLQRRSTASTSETVRKNAKRQGGNLQNVFDEFAGTREPSGREEVARFFSGVRQFEVSAKLGGAVLSAFTDVGYGAFNRHFNGLPMWRTMGEYIKTLKPGSRDDRDLAMYLGFGAQEMAERGQMQMRLMGEQTSGPVMQWLADRTIRLSGLSRWTNAGQWASGFGFVTHISRMARQGKTFEQLEPRFAGALERYGIGAVEWDHIRHQPLEEIKGVPFIVPTKIEDRAIGDRLLRMIVTEADFATPMVDLRTRALVNGMLPQGRPVAELIRSSPMMFKTFGLSIYSTHGRRLLEMGVRDRFSYAARLFMLTTGASAMVIWAKDIRDGKDPRDPTSPEFIKAAIAQGGGLGPLGDFAYAGTNDHGGNVGDWLAGPALGTVGDIMNAGAKNTKRALDGNPDTKTSVGKDALKIAKGNIPVVSSLWYTRLAVERLFLDELARAADDDYEAAQRRMDQRAAEQGTDYFWGPGDSLSDARTPDLTNIWDRPPAEE